MCRGIGAKRWSKCRLGQWSRASGGQHCNMHLLWVPVTLLERRGDLWEPHGTRLRLRGMARLPGAKAGSPHCCLPVGLWPGLCRHQLLPKDISWMVAEQCYAVRGGKNPFGVFWHRNPRTVLNCLSNTRDVFSTAGWVPGETDTFEKVAEAAVVLAPSQRRTPTKQVSNSPRA